jgi:Ca2+-transporting ATPase
MLGMANIRKSAFRLFRPREWLIWFAFVLGLGLQILVTEVPFLTLAFNTVELSITEWLILALISSAPLIVHEIIVLGLFIKNKVQK